MELHSELLKISEELSEGFKQLKLKKKAAIEKYWVLSGKKVRLIETGEIFYARPHDIYTDYAISCVIRYDLCKSANLKRKVLTVRAEEIEEA